MAAYFAAAQNWENDGAIWLVHPTTLLDAVIPVVPNEEDFDKVVAGEAPPSLVTPVVSYHKTERMIAQQGHFTMSFALTLEQDEAIDAVCGEAFKAAPNNLLV